MRPTRLAIVVLVVVVTAAACHKRAPKIIALPPAPPPPVTSPSVTPTPVTLPTVAPPVEPPSPAVAYMDEGDRAFAAAHYDDAAGAYENYLRVAPSGLARDHVLYQLGLTYALRAAPTDWQRAMAMFKQLIEEYPESPLKGPANLI